MNYIGRILNRKDRSIIMGMYFQIIKYNLVGIQWTLKCEFKLMVNVIE